MFKESKLTGDRNDTNCSPVKDECQQGLRSNKHSSKLNFPFALGVQGPQGAQGTKGAMGAMGSPGESAEAGAPAPPSLPGPPGIPAVTSTNNNAPTGLPGSAG